MKKSQMIMGNPNFVEPLKRVVALSLLALGGVLSSQAQTYLIDFGGANTTTHGPAPEDPVRYWNNVTTTVGSSDAGVLTNLVASDNSSSPINLEMISRFNGANENGTLEYSGYPSEATRDSLFGNTEAFSGLSDVFPSFKLTGLDASTVYRFTFYASRTGVGDVRETGYTVAGENSGFAALDVANNIENTVEVVGIKPDASGSITISLAPTENNNNANHFTYLGVLQIDAVPPQQPISFTEHPASQSVIEFLPVTFRAAVQGTAPYFIQWLKNGEPIPDATQWIYTIPSVTADMDGARFSVTVSNLAYSATSSNATLRVITDTTAPTLASATAGGSAIEITFSEPVEAGSAENAANYMVNNGQVGVMSAALKGDGKTVALALDQPVTGSLTIRVSQVRDLAGNAIATGASISVQVAAGKGDAFYFDFGGGNTTENAPAPDDPANAWNNITASLAATEGNELPNLVTGDNTATEVGLVILSRFNGANENGTLTSPLFPSDATRDSLYGNTEAFNNLTDIFPSFKLTGLDASQAYQITFYASRTGVSDNRETGYTVVGAVTNLAALNVANNITNLAKVSGIRPSAGGEITISLAPTANNNNANHFTYLGVMVLEPAREELLFLAPEIKTGQITLRWSGTGQLEKASTITGPWSAVTPAPASPYTEAIVPSENRFYRLKSNP